MSTHWEYLVLRVDRDPTPSELFIYWPHQDEPEMRTGWHLGHLLNELGADRWEMCDRTLLDSIAFPGRMDEGRWKAARSHSNTISWVFKRPRD